MCAKSASAEAAGTAASSRRNFAANLWIFHSNKNRRYLHIEGDLPFMHCVLLEGRADIASYQPPRAGVSFESAPRLRSYTVARDFAGNQTWFGYYHGASLGTEPLRARREALCTDAAMNGARGEMMTERQLEGHRILFDNWLVLSRAMTAAGSCPRDAEAEALTALLNARTAFELGRALQWRQCDPAIMLAVVARQLQLGNAKADLTTALLAPTTLICGGRA
ncbi:hypothetical protein [Cupriavidus pampae]|uniref:AraC family transcriptional regulator n=1 Tax=Cupriavidus pampae TaxID=659251 RepID=A0ABM8WFL6_9BURK|nr:hypothetical protein [Cupriavidus pampae]CAG9166112.1 hypothetical protein LMG32289_00929 [Cupriavidus pampae]